MTKTPQTLLSDIHRLYTSAFYKQLRLEGIDLSRAQWRVIALLRNNNGQTQSELAETLLMEKAPLGVLLDKLEQKQLIERQPDQNDRRAKRIFLTNESKPLIPIIEKASNKLLDTAKKGLSSHDMKELMRILAVLRNNLKSQRQQLAKDKS
jgi:DNA-binding MarR family transcriptional regulator